jgi:hypothetical protein
MAEANEGEVEGLRNLGIKIWNLSFLKIPKFFNYFDVLSKIRNPKSEIDIP